MTSMTYFKLIKIDAISSTNDFLKESYNNGNCSDGDLVLAKHQTSGRGQRGSSWVSSPENSLTFSVYKIFEGLTSANAFFISTSVSVCLVRVLKEIGIPDVSVKWPNDILSANRKIGGILIENFLKKNELKASIIGIGLNINDFSFENLPFAGSLEMASGLKRDSEAVFDILKPKLEITLFSLNLISKNKSINEYSQLLWRKNKLSLFETKGRDFKAILKDVTESGNLILEDLMGVRQEMGSHEVKMKYEINN
jgi:BirA family biotin operon repressor/biotin-[acetyl-CoA-carboxylase] ligase